MIPLITELDIKKDRERFDFVPGNVVCESCDFRPEDPWDPSPEGFEKIDGTYFCEVCAGEVGEQS